MTIIQKLQAKKSKKGFTLVELVIVIAILAILAAIAIPVVNSVITTANDNTFRSNVQTMDLVCKEVSAGLKGDISEYTTKFIKGNVDSIDKVTVGAILDAYGIAYEAEENIVSNGTKGLTAVINQKGGIVVADKGENSTDPNKNATPVTSATTLYLLGLGTKTETSNP